MPALFPRRLLRPRPRAPAPAPTPPPVPRAEGGGPIPDWDWRLEARMDDGLSGLARRQNVSVSDGGGGTSGGASATSAGSSSSPQTSRSSSSSSSSRSTSSPSSSDPGSSTSLPTTTSSSSTPPSTSSDTPPPSTSASESSSSESRSSDSTGGATGGSTGASSGSATGRSASTGTDSTGPRTDSGSLTSASTGVFSVTTNTVVPITTETSSPVVVTNSDGQQSTITSVIGITLSSTVSTVNVVTGTAPVLHGSGRSGSAAFFHNTGAVAGVFVVVGLAVAAILLGLAFVYVRRKRARELQEDLRVAAGGAGDGGAGRNRVGEFDDDEDGFLYDGSGSRSARTAGSSWGNPGAGDGASNNTNTPLMTQYHPAAGAPNGSQGILAAAQGYHPGHGHSGSLNSNMAAPLMAGGAAGAGLYGAYNGYGANGSPNGHEQRESGSYYGDTPHDSYGYARAPTGDIGDAHAPGDYDPNWQQFVASGMPTVHYGEDGDGPPRPSGESQEGMLNEGRYHDDEDGDDAGSGGDESPHVPVDQRLDPKTMLLNLNEQHGGSVNSLRDNEDYSRKILKVANPSEE